MRYNISKHATATWKKFSSIYPEMAKYKQPAIVLNNRLTRTAGYNPCHDNIIVLGTKFLEKYPEIMLNIILPHEMAHQVDFNLNGWQKYKRHHGKAWQEIMLKYGLSPDPYHTMEL